jgi:hypothetical protein
MMKRPADAYTVVMGILHTCLVATQALFLACVSGADFRML